MMTSNSVQLRQAAEKRLYETIKRCNIASKMFIAGEILLCCLIFMVGVKAKILLIVALFLIHFANESGVFLRVWPQTSCITTSEDAGSGIEESVFQAV